MMRGATGSTTIESPPVTGGASTITSRAAVSLIRVFFTAQDLEDKSRLYRVLYDLQRFAFAAIRPLGMNPILFGNIIGPLTFAGGDTQTVPHYLGRAFTGFLCVDAETAAWAGYRTSLPTGASSEQLIAIHSANAGTYRFLVW